MQTALAGPGPMSWITVLVAASAGTSCRTSGRPTFMEITRGAGDTRRLSLLGLCLPLACSRVFLDSETTRETSSIIRCRRVMWRTYAAPQVQVRATLATWAWLQLFANSGNSNRQVMTHLRAMGLILLVSRHLVVFRTRAISV